MKPDNNLKKKLQLQGYNYIDVNPTTYNEIYSDCDDNRIEVLQ